MPVRAVRFRVAIVLIVLVVVTLLRVALLRDLSDQSFFSKYLVFADAVLEGNPPTDRMGDVSAGYLWAVVAFRSLGMGVEGIRAVQMAFVVLAALFAAGAAFRLGGRVAGISTLLFLLGSQAAFINATEFEPETLILLLNSAALALVIAVTNEDGSRRSLWSFLAGFAAGCSVVTRPTAAL